MKRILTAFLLFLGCSFCCYDLSAQTIVDSVVVFDQDSFLIDTCTCKQLIIKRSQLADLYYDEKKKVQSRIDSLNKIDFPCYEYSAKSEILRHFEDNRESNSKECNYVYMGCYVHPYDFKFYILKQRRLNVSNPTYSGEIICSDDLN